MRRVGGWIAFITGGVLLFLAGVAPVYLLPRVQKAPTDKYSTIISTGSGRYLSPKTLSLTDTRPIQVTQIYKGQPGNSSEDVAVVSAFTKVTDTSQPVDISYSEQTYALDRTSGLAVNCCGASPPASGETLKFPFGSQQITYPFYDQTADRAFPAEFVRAEELDGLSTYVYQSHVPDTPIGTLDVPGSVAGQPNQQSVTVTVHFTNDTTVWIEPITGAVIKGAQRPVQTAVDSTGKTVATLADLDVAYSPQTVKTNVDDYGPQASRLSFLEDLPLIALIAGLVLVVGGLVLLVWWWRTTPPTPARVTGVEDAMASIGRFAVRFRYVIVLGWVALTVLAVVALPSLASVTNTSNGAFLPEGSPTTEAMDLETPFQPPDQTSATIVAVRNDGALTQADETEIQRVEEDAAKVKNVTLVQDQGESPDHHAEKALVLAQVQLSSPAAEQVVDDIRQLFTSTHPPAGLTFNLTGQLASNVDNVRANEQAQKRTELLTNLVILTMLIIVYRAALAPLVTLLPAVLVLTMAGPVIAEASKIGVQVSSVTQIMLTVLVLGAGTDYGLFLILRTREEIGRGREPKEAVVRAASRVGESISYSAGTVMVALLSLLLATFGLYKGLGPSLAIGIAFMLLAGLTLTPALLAIFGRAIFWPRHIPTGPEKEGLWARVAERVVAHPVVTLLAGVIFLGALASAVVWYEPTGFAGSTTGPPGSDSAQGQAAIAAHYPPAVANPTLVLLEFKDSVWEDLTPVQKAENELGGLSVFKSVNGALNPAGQPVDPDQLSMLYRLLGPPQQLPPTPPAGLSITQDQYNGYRAEAQFVSADGRTVQYYTTLSAGGPSSTAAMNATPAVRSGVNGVARDVGAFDNGVLGTSTISYDVSAASKNDLSLIVPVVLLLIGILLGLVLRSIVAPIPLAASVLLSYLASLGLAVIIFIKLGNQSGLNFVLPFLMFVFLIALGEDYNILVMSRIREESRVSPRAAVKNALHHTGTTVTSAGLILAATFATAAITGGSSQITQLGTAIALGVLLDTFLVRTLLVPSVVTLLGRWNWWPSKLARRPRVSVEPGAEVPAL